MSPQDLLKTVYLGDRGCMSILFDAWKSEIKIQVTCISRIRGDAWNFYSDEDLPNGFLVFEGVSGLAIDPLGAIPNDLINELAVETFDANESTYLFSLRVDSVNAQGDRLESSVRIVANSFVLESAAGERIDC